MKRLLALSMAVAGLAATAFAPAAGAADATDTVPAPTPIVTSLGGTPLVQLSDGGGGLPYLGSTTSYNAGSLVQVLTAYHDTGVYENGIAQVDAVAAKYLNGWLKTRSVAARKHGSAARVKARAAHKDNGGDGDRRGGQKWWNKKQAIVFDVDETVLSNYTAIVADGFVYGPKSQSEAVDEIGTAIKPSLDLFNLAKAKGIAVFFITGRGEAQRAPTEDNLKREGFTGYQQAILKPAGFTGTTVAYKAGARKAIEDQGYNIVASVGDQYSDLAGGYADRLFKLPNPFYFLP
jgi:predicted secreted acid phosphatase